MSKWFLLPRHNSFQILIWKYYCCATRNSHWSKSLDIIIHIYKQWNIEIARKTYQIYIFIELLINLTFYTTTVFKCSAQTTCHNLMKSMFQRKFLRINKPKQVKLKRRKMRWKYNVARHPFLTHFLLIQNCLYIN